MSDLIGSTYDCVTLFSDGVERWRIGYFEYDDGVMRWEISSDTDETVLYYEEISELLANNPQLEVALASQRLHCVGYFMGSAAVNYIYHIG